METARTLPTGDQYLRNGKNLTHWRPRLVNSHVPKLLETSTDEATTPLTLGGQGVRNGKNLT